METVWTSFVDGHPDSTAYHLWQWRNVFERAFGRDCDYLVARRSGYVTGVLPLVHFQSGLFGRFSVSLPFVNYGGVLANDTTSARALLEHATRLAAGRRSSHVELRHRVRCFSDLPARHHKVTMLLTLAGDRTTMWERLDRKVRNQIRKAEKSGLAAVVGGKELLGEFYEIFARNMRDLGTPVYPRQFFEAVLDEFPQQTSVIVVRHGIKAVAAGISFAYRNVLEVPWASSLGRYRALCPNNLLYWTFIEHAIVRGLSMLDFGRSTPGEGTFHFKRQWGAEPRALWWEYELLARHDLPEMSPANRKYRLAIALWKWLPVWMATVIGPRIVRSIP